jgi:hypothetical protein
MPLVDFMSGRGGFSVSGAVAADLGLEFVDVGGCGCPCLSPHPLNCAGADQIARRRIR